MLINVLKSLADNYQEQDNYRVNMLSISYDRMLSFTANTWFMCIAKAGMRMNEWASLLSCKEREKNDISFFIISMDSVSVCVRCRDWTEK